MAGLQPKCQINKWCGLVAGYPASLQVRRLANGDTLGAYLGIRLPNATVGVDASLVQGVGLKYSMTLLPGVGTGWESRFLGAGAGSGPADVFRNPWAEAVRESSPHFPGDKLDFKATVKLAVKQ